MEKNTPAVYVLHGDDEYRIAQVIAELKAKLGDPSLIEMNSSKLDGATATIDVVASAALPMPFLANRRVVVLERAHKFVERHGAQKTGELLDKVTQTTALFLVSLVNRGEKRPDRETKKEIDHLNLLLQWVEQSGGRGYEKAYNQPRGGEMAAWIEEQARKNGGQFDRRAARYLAGLVGDDTRLASQEITKLLTYVNYERAVDEEDVQQLTPLEGELADFALANALRSKKMDEAIRVLQKELETKDARGLQGGLIHEYRLLLLARDLLDEGLTPPEAAAQLQRVSLQSGRKVSAYPAQLAVDSARLYRKDELERVYRRLLELDNAVKTGELPDDLALFLLLAEQLPENA